MLLTARENMESMNKAQEKADKAAAAKGTTKKRKSASKDDDYEDGDETEAGASKPSKKKKTAGGAPAPGGGDLFSISLSGDDDASVEIYDSCDEIRRKINKHLIGSGPGITKTSFLRDISRAAYSDAPNIQSKQLSDFLTKKGPTAGSTSRVFYAAYVYFEKKRISEDKPKSKHRQDMEARWGGLGGLPRDRPNRGYWCAAGDVIVQDKLGAVRAVPGRGRR